MKRKCKNIDITDLNFLATAIYECLKNKSRTRKDVVRFNSEYPYSSKMALEMREEIRNHRLNLKPIWYKDKYDQASGKTRHIGIQDIKQQFYDYAVINALVAGGVGNTIGAHQYASIRGRGQLKGAQRIHKWLKDRDSRYYIKMDVKSYYKSIPQKKLISYLHKVIKNDDLLWLIEELLKTFDEGLAVGSYMSQFLANLYMSVIYHKVEEMHRIRHSRGKEIRMRLVYHQLIYMDDILIIGRNARDLISAAQMIESECAKLGLTIKDGWAIQKLGNGAFIDMMGFRIYRDHITIRRKNFKRIRRAYIRFARKSNSLRMARRIVSFYGWLKHSNSIRFCHKYNVYELTKKARRIISNDSKVRCRTVTS